MPDPSGGVRRSCATPALMSRVFGLTATEGRGESRTLREPRDGIAAITSDAQILSQEDG